ncbi:MAG: hypothetical protein V2J07_08630 [Anaerolineae bacterium]|jgi:hypothetical protein|nr:hypothetical protein [Anaerolineae bacterium]
MKPYCLKHQPKILFIAFFFLIATLSACTSNPSPEMVMDVPQKPVVINVGMTSALAQYEDAVKTCATDVEVLVDVLPWIRLQSAMEDVYIVYGDAGKEMPEYVYQIGESELVYIVNPDLPIEEITLEQLKAIFNGEMVDWVEYAITSSYMGEIQPWGYMDNTEIMQAALEMMALPNPSGQWQVAPTPADVVDTVAQDQNAIGVVPNFAVTGDVRVLEINGLDSPAIPLLAIWDYEPGEAEQNWLLCVQAAIE